MRFSLFYFAAGQAGDDPYATLRASAGWADEAGFEAVWLPERHLHSFGGLYPAPAVLAAALAVTTTRLQLRAGSVVAPLNHPLRVAEAWSVVDNLSGGRVGISLASGWHREDFVLADEPFENRVAVTQRRLDQIRRLWRGAAVELPLPGQPPVMARLHPRPLQPELPLWLTTGGSIPTAEFAGREGTNLLTHLLGQDYDDLRAVVEAYRAAYRPRKPSNRGTVTLMLHTHVRADAAEAVRVARPHFVRYLRVAADLQLRAAARGALGIDPDELDDDDLEVLAEHAVAGYLTGQSLVGDPEGCAEVVRRAAECGVDEIGCLVDFVADPAELMAGLPALDQLHRRSLDH